MRLLSRPLRVGFSLIAVAQLGVIAAGLASLVWFGPGCAALAGVLVLSLLVLNRGLLLVHRRFTALEEFSRRLRLLAEMNVRVNREILLNEDIEFIYRTILDYLFQIFNKASGGSVQVLEDNGYFSIAACRGFTEEFINKFHLRLEDSFLYQATGGNIKDTRLFSSKDFQRIETFFQPGEWEFRSVINAPIFIGDRLFGALSLDSAIADTYNMDDVQIVDQFRTQIEIALLARERYTTNIQRYQVDALTGLFTRRHFEDRLKVSLVRALRQQESFVLALFDVDDLKATNDSLGHLAGDQMLLTIASALRTSCRHSDIIGRLGGDEFIACYHESETRVMEKNIADIRAKLQAKPLRTGDSECHLSFSYGLATFPDDGTTQDALVAAADKRLYAMKSLSK